MIPMLNLDNHSEPDLCLLSQAVTLGASDIHLEASEKIGRIRFRLDGSLSEIASIARSTFNNLVARLKIRAQMDIAEKRLPQDGRFTVNLNHGHNYHCRVNACPTAFGEKLVLRLLSPPDNLPTLVELFKEPELVAKLTTLLNSSQGLILITGPTGSGKTTTLYSMLDHLPHNQLNLTTIEDPIEIYLPKINQIEVDYKIGFDFVTALRAILRQDPDVIMVGEIRDPETAQIAFNAAQTGHLVLATLHTTSTANTITRLLNMNIEPYKLASALKLIIAQRLVRKLCPHCKLSNLYQGSRPEFVNKRLFLAQSCTNCHHGYQGRVAIFECLFCDVKIRQLLSRSSSIEQLESDLEAEPYLKLWQLGSKLVRNGTTSLAEIEHVLL